MKKDGEVIQTVHVRVAGTAMEDTKSLGSSQEDPQSRKIGGGGQLASPGSHLKMVILSSSYVQLLSVSLVFLSEYFIVTVTGTPQY